MTEPKEAIQKSDAFVVVFDICSSTSMLEDLILNGKVEAMRNLLIEMKEFLEAYQSRLPYNVYKFIGDGWILLFPQEANGENLVHFLEELSFQYLSCFERQLQPVLSRGHEPNGLTFGIDRGPLVSFVMMEQGEYVGRPLNVASRLQGEVKALSDSPAFKVLLSNAAYNSLGIHNFRTAEKRTVPLRNIQGGASQDCFLLTLKVSHPAVSIESEPRLSVSRGLPLTVGSRNKAWYYWKNDQGKGFILAFVNARGSSSIRTFDADRGTLLNRSYKSGNYQDNFSDLIKDARELAVSVQPNLERDCKEKLPDELLVELKGQFQK